MKVKYNEGDLVKVIQPLFVVRVGYPISLEAALTHSDATFENEVVEFCDKVRKSYPNSEVDYPWQLTKETKFYAEVMKAVASNHLRQVRFGGSERTIHTALEEEFRDTTPWLVESKRRVKPGTYEPGHTDYDGDYTGPYLSNEKTHILLKVTPNFPTGSQFGYFRGSWEIESVNVELTQ